MWTYYDLTIAQTQADRIASAGYRVSPAAQREFPQEAVARAFAEKHEEEKMAARARSRTAVAAFVGAVKAFFRGSAALAR